MTELTDVKEKLDGIREKIQNNHNVSADKSFMKATLNTYLKCLPEINIKGI